MADYKYNIGAYQNDSANSSWKFNIGAAQTDAPEFGDVDKVISGTGSIVLEGISIAVNLQGIDLTGEGSIEIAGYGVTNTFNIGHLLGDPTIAIRPGQDPGCDQTSADVWSPAQPTEMPALLGNGALENVEVSAADERDHLGSGLINAHEIFWYETAHLIPRLVQDVGNLVTDQNISCELYNADRYNAITVSSIVDNLGNGFLVTGVPATPFNIASQDSLLFTIKVLQSGDLQIDGTYTLVLSTGEEYTIQIIGSRIVLIPIRPEAPLKEHLQWDTKILQAVSGNEQRIANRHMPRELFELTYKAGRKRMEMILFDRQARLIAIPAWHEPSFVSSAVTAGDYTVNVGTTDYANFYVGGYAVVLKDEWTFDVLEIESMTGTSITFTTDLANSYSVNTQVMPLMTGYVQATTPAIKAIYNEQTFKLKAHIRTTDNDIADASGWSIYNSKVFLDDPNFVKNHLSEILETKVYVLDNVSGDHTQSSMWDHNARRSRKGFFTNSRADLWKLRQLLHYLRGRQVSFYIPTFTKDIVPNSTLVNSTSTITMDNIGYTLNAHERWPKQVIRVHLTDGTILIRTIQNSAELSFAEEQLTVDTAWPYDIEPEDIERIEFLEKVRFDSDDIVILHKNALGTAECIVPTKEVFD
jgi:hypothetical protein